MLEDECMEVVETPFQYSIEYVRAGTGSIVEKFGAKCGQVKFIVACKDHPAHKKYFNHHCGRFQCPVCMEAASKRLARSVRDRIQGLSKCLHKEKVMLGRMKHIAWSIPIDRYSKEKVEADCGKTLYKEFGRLVKKVAKNGFYGGCAVLHVERKKHSDGSECRLKGCQRHHKWVFGPHFHYLGYGFFKSSVEVERESGWVYHIIGDKGERDPYATVHYELTHCALFIDQDGKQLNQVVRWLGFLSNSKGGKRVVEKRHEYEFCPVCKSVMHKYGVDEHDEYGINWNYDQGELYHNIEVVEWYLTKKGKNRVIIKSLDGG